MRLVMYVVAMGMVGSADVNQLQIDEVLMVLHSAVLDVLKDEVQIDVATIAFLHLHQSVSCG